MRAGRGGNVRGPQTSESQWQPIITTAMIAAAKTPPTDVLQFVLSNALMVSLIARFRVIAARTL